MKAEAARIEIVGPEVVGLQSVQLPPYLKQR